MEHQKSYFGSLVYQVLPQQQVFQGVLEIFLSCCSIRFLIAQFPKVSKVKSDLKQAPQNTSKHQISAKSVKGLLFK